MTDITIDLAGPGGRIAGQAAADAQDAAVDAAGHAGTAARYSDVAKAVTLTAPTVYPTRAAGVAAVADGATFWAQTPGKIVTLYRRSGAGASTITSLGNNSPVNLSSFALPDGKSIRSAAIAAGSTTLTANKAVFDASDVGKLAVVTDAGAAGKLVSTITAYVSPTQVTLAQAATTAIADKGVSIGTDCGPGLTAALAAIEAQRGGTLVIDGVYLLRTPAALLSKGAQDVQIRGTGGDSGIIVAGERDSEAMIRLDNIGRLLIDDVNFAGTFTEADDCRRLFYVSNSFVRFTGCGFFGLSCISNTAAAAIHAEQCDLELRNNEFGGCVFSSGNGNAVVSCNFFVGYRSQGNRWIDYGQWQGELWSKTGIAFSGSWVAIGQQKGQTANATGQSVVRFTDDRFDEGHVAGISVGGGGDGPRVSRLLVDGCQFNNTFIEGGTAIFARGIDHVEILRTAIGFTTQPRDAVTLIDIGEAVIDRLLATNAATGLFGQNVGSIVLADSPGITRFSLTGVGRFSRSERGAGGIVVQTKNGRITDDDFPAPPPVGTIAADPANARLYLRTEAGWLATAPLTPNTDPLLALSNATPAKGQLVTGGYRKTGAPAWGDCTANSFDTVTGKVRFRVKFPVGGDQKVGLVDATMAGPDYVSSVDGIYLGVLQAADGTIRFNNGGGVGDPIAYTLGQEIEFTYDPSTGAIVMKVAGAQVFAQAGPINPGFVSRFSSAMYSTNSEFTLLEFASF
ncbi:MAG: hypothetical protein GY736_05060 [Sphingomonas sp.]|uniref:hypothetical protein n=1 Tax=Sphingomonas sp. TaxID=28214 RepID=UPI0025854464|nr:hypothetical protein [Sphingomonas sp.]MCP4025668.1 hypothetical protein [Sphingomonas sp.]